MQQINDEHDLDIALKEYDIATQHYLHEDKMKNESLKRSIIVVVTISSIIVTILSLEDITNNIILKQLAILLFISGAIISLSYGIQYRRILKYQDVKEARLEELERIFENSKYFTIKTISYGLELSHKNKLNVCDNKFYECVEFNIVDRISSSSFFKIVFPWGIIIMWCIFLFVVYIIIN